MVTLHGRRVINIRVSGVDPYDYPDFSDAYVESAEFADTGESLEDWELDTIRQDHPDMVFEDAMAQCMDKADRAEYLCD